MIDDALIDDLESMDPEVRKRAVRALAQTKDPDALPHLASVVREDSDAEVRDLARKAGIYIKKQSGGAAPARESERSTVALPADETMSLYEDAPRQPPLPSEIQVSELEVQRAKGLVDQAVDLHMRGDNERAAQNIRKALKANPKLIHDAYTKGLAANVTGLDPDTAIRLLSPKGDELARRASGGVRTGAGLERLFALGMMAAAIIAIAGYMFLPWFDVGAIKLDMSAMDATSAAELAAGLEQMGIDSEEPTLGELWDAIDELFGALGAFAGGDELFGEYLDALDGINFEVSGLNTALVAIGAQDQLEFIGLDGLYGVTDAAADEFGEFGLFGDVDPTETAALSESLEPDTLDYTLLLLPVAAILAVLIGLLLFMRPSLGMWLLALLVGIAAILPVAYFFTRGEEALRNKIDWGTLLDLPAPDYSLIGAGFWVSAAGAALLLFIPFIAMMLMPSSDNSAG
jgi:hypothetical protein